MEGAEGAGGGRRERAAGRAAGGRREQSRHSIDAWITPVDMNRCMWCARGWGEAGWTWCKATSLQADACSRARRNAMIAV